MEKVSRPGRSVQLTRMPLNGSIDSSWRDGEEILCPNHISLRLATVVEGYGESEIE